MMQAYDYDFKGVTLRMWIQKSVGISSVLVKDPEDPASLQQDDFIKNIYKYLSQISVDIGLGYQQKISVVLEPTYEDGIKLIDSEWLNRGNILYVQWGYAKENQLSLPYAGIILEQPDVTIDPDFTVTINARGWGYIAQRTCSIADPLVGTPNQIIEKIVIDKWKLDIDDDLASDKYWDMDINEEPKGRSDFLVVRDIAAKSGNYFYISGNVVNIISVAEYSKGTPKYTFRLFGELDLKNKVYPINKFSYESGAMFLPGAVRRTFGVGTNFKKKKMQSGAVQAEPGAGAKPTDVQGKGATKGEMNPSIPKKTETGDQVLDTGMDKPTVFGEKQIIYKPMESDGKVIDELEGWYDMRVPYAEIEFESIGIPGVGPRDVVRVDGVGTKLSGNYMVFGLIHDLSDSGYSLHVTARTRDSVQLVNKTEPETGDKNTVQPKTK